MTRPAEDRPTRIIVCGGRSYTDRERVEDVLREYMPPPGRRQPTIVHGDGRGADRLAAEVGLWCGFWIEAHPAHWQNGRSAGPRRNEEMAKLGADLCIAFPGGNGTEDMIRRAEAHHIPVRRVEA